MPGDGTQPPTRGFSVRFKQISQGADFIENLFKALILQSKNEIQGLTFDS